MYICIEIKKTKMKYTCTTISQCILTLFLFGSLSSNAQPAGWTYKVPVQVTNGSAAPRINYQELITINTQIPIAAGNMLASGNDIRFIDSCGSVVFQHWVESGINTPATKIWVMIPSIPASSTVSFWLFYGNPSAVNTESFPAVFPAAFITGGSNVTLTGTQTYDWFRIDASDTLFIQAGAPLTINARNAVINGVVHGVGRGNQAPGPNLAGTGTGGGETSVNAGSAGGSYAGTGGSGGFDLGDALAAGGPIYGTTSGVDSDMGSSGGSGTTEGGSGGGAFDITAEFVLITGIINVTGDSAINNGATSRGGGGGSGGCVKVTSDRIQNSGTVTARGGKGAAGSSPASDSGGGGGGGRIKLLYDAALSGAGVLNSNGGLGGPNGGQGPGQPGASGTTYSGVMPFPNNIIVIGSQSIYTTNLSLTLSDPDTAICAGSPLTVTGSAGFTTYTFYLNGLQMSSSATPSYVYNGLVDNDSISVEALSLCVPDTQYFFITVLAPTVVNYTETTTMVCVNWPVFALTPGTPAGGTYSGPGVTGNNFDPAAAGAGTHDIIYSYGTLCVNTDTSQIVVDPCVGIAGNPPANSVSISPNPSSGKFQISTGRFQAGELEVYNVLGEKVYTSVIKNQTTTIDLTDKAQGVYFLEISIDGEKSVRKIVKQ